MSSFSIIRILLLCIASFSLLASPSFGHPDNHLLSGEQLNTGQSLTEGTSQFIIQDDCNLVLYKMNIVKWQSNTTGEGSGCYVTFNKQGNLVIHNNKNRVIWSSNSSRKQGNYILILQKDGNLVIYSKPIWATGTNSYGSTGVIVATALNGTIGVTGAKQNKVREMGKIVQVKSDK
uniref:Lectin n=1 Tax=Bulbophyllum morphologorum TaxID=907950 RepID=F8SK84_9ASPA|nr:lectin [Bulbophyllum morphologorum]